MICKRCKKPILPNEDNVYCKVEGWVKKRKAGGYNNIFDFQYLGEYAHSGCFEYKFSTDSLFST